MHRFTLDMLFFHNDDLPCRATRVMRAVHIHCRCTTHEWAALRNRILVVSLIIGVVHLIWPRNRGFGGFEKTVENIASVDRVKLLFILTFVKVEKHTFGIVGMDF